MKQKNWLWTLSMLLNWRIKKTSEWERALVEIREQIGCGRVSCTTCTMAPDFAISCKTKNVFQNVAKTNIYICCTSGRATWERERASVVSLTVYQTGDRHHSSDIDQYWPILSDTYLYFTLPLFYNIQLYNSHVHP